MNRSQKISFVKISFVGLFIMAIILLAFLNFPIDTLAIILYPLITVLVLVWRSIRDDYDLFIRKKLAFDINNDMSEVTYQGKVFLRDMFRKVIFYKFTLNAEGVLNIHIDIANKGNSDITLHDYQLKLLYPKEEQLLSVPLFETVRVYNPIESRITEETNYLQRKKLERGGLHTRIFPLEKKYDYMLIRIEIYTYRCEATHDYLFVFRGDTFFYTRCLKNVLFKRNDKYYIKNKAKIEKFIQEHL